MADKPTLNYKSNPDRLTWRDQDRQAVVYIHGGVAYISTPDNGQVELALDNGHGVPVIVGDFFDQYQAGHIKKQLRRILRRHWVKG